ncbi:MAG TPA: glycosyltransferase family 4 protein, partial [Tepidisphaeraceae bacterium]
RFVVAQVGARMHYAVPALLERAGLLRRLYTDLSADTGWVAAIGKTLPGAMTPAPLRRLLARRIDGVPASKIRSFPRWALARILRRSGAGTSPGSMLRHFARENERFCRLVLEADGLRDADALYAFSSAGLELMREARQRSMWIVMEQIAAPFEHDEPLLAEERQRWPGWEPGGATPDDWQPLASREREEWQLADVILCASEYVRDCVQSLGGPAEKCRIVPYGVDPAHFEARERTTSDEVHPLRALCVATVQLRKGVQYLLRAAQALKQQNVQIRLVGPVSMSRDAVAQLRSALDLAGPVPRSRMCEEYARADLLVLPTLSEGSATVCYEALAAGLPVITTPNAGSVVRDGVDAFIVPIRDSDAIAARLAQLASDRALLQTMSIDAVERARDFTWERYGQRLIQAVVPTPALK